MRLLHLFALSVATAVCLERATADICSDATSCKIQPSGNECDRGSDDCPPCLRENRRFFVFTNYECYNPNRNDECPDETVYCPPTAPSASSSNSGSGSDTTESSKDSESGSGSVTPTETPEPTTVTPEPTTLEPTAAPTEPTTTAPAATPSSAQTDNEGSSSKMPLVVGIIVGAIAVIAVLAFFIWKRSRDEEESDDEEYRPKNAPAPAYNPSAGAGGASRGNVAVTVASADQPPASRTYTAAGAAYGGASTSQYPSNNAYGASSSAAYGGATSTYAVPSSAYATPSTAGNKATTTTPARNDTTTYTGAQYDRLGSFSDSHSSTDSHDVWGNKTKDTRPPPSNKKTALEFSDTRSMSNVSVEF